MLKHGYYKNICERLFKSFPEGGLITLAAMMGAYDQWRESQDFYYQYILNYVKKLDE